MSDFLAEPDETLGKPIQQTALPENEISDRALQAGNAMIDANDAFKYAGVAPTAEDIRSLAITFLIGEGKDNRTAKIGQNRRYTPAPTPAPQAPTNPEPKPHTEGKLPFLVLEDNVPTTFIVISDDGEFQGKFGINHGFTVNVAGVKYKFTTTSKAVIPKMIPGANVTLKRYKNSSNQTRYEVS